MDTDRFLVSSLVRASVCDDGLVLLDVRRGLVLTSNAVGARIWHLIEQRHSCAEIAARLVEDYRILPDRAAADVERFVTSLMARDLVTMIRSC